MPIVTDLSALGWTPDREAELPAGCVPARVTRVDRGRLSVVTPAGERRVSPGSGVYAGGGAAGPAVGDWVALRGELVVAVLRRTSAFTRTAAGRSSEAQVVAANLDVVLVVDSLATDARLRRVERYLAVAWSSGATPVVVLPQADLCDDVPPALGAGAAGAPRVARLAGSSVTPGGLDP